MTAKKRVNMEEYYSGLHNMPFPVFSKHLKRKTKCRVCLQDGDMPLTSVKNASEIEKTMSIFANIEIYGNEEDPVCLCYICYKFMKSATLFRKVLHRTNETLQQPVVKESPQHITEFDDFDDPFDDDDKSDILDSNNGAGNDNRGPLNTNNDSNKNVDKKSKKNVERKKKASNKNVKKTYRTKVQCPICKKILNKFYYKNIHVKLHNPDLPEQFVCEICGKSFKLKKVYNSHMERHETRYIFKCELCPYAARYKERLYMHMRVHNGELKFLCTQCPARYITKGSLSAHIKLKHTEPQFKCNSCTKAFHNGINLQRHIDVVHLGIKNNVCNVCGKAFGYRRDMLDHQKGVHKMKTSTRPFVRVLPKKNNNPNAEGNLDSRQNTKCQVQRATNHVLPYANHFPLFPTPL